MIDLSRMDSIRVDPTTETARVEPGVVLGELARETHAFGFETPVGYNSTTGVAGLTLGGGFSWLSRKYGVTIDNLLSADVVTAEGELVHASGTDNERRFRRLQRGENFTVVTCFKFQLPRRESATDR
jgi:FAD/FMN-containing dehydrogenase